MTDLTAPELVLVDLRAADRVDATRQLAQTLVDAGRVTDLEGFLADVAAREEQMATGIPGGIGLPHARSAAVTVPSLAIGRVVNGTGIDWGAPDGPANLVFLIAAPAEGEADHLTILAALARKLVHVSFRQSLLEAPDAAAVASTVLEEVYGR
ncbi:PTS sugar transporter subunit IIA [Kineococcus sp. SYSU DK001]|uniref:PTS sugar transporter subunit IIA n=1 Tax=Kineococcus sp. SYSU DK001 TaxID=3383122 RepID=UPI003D7DCCE1